MSQDFDNISPDFDSLVDMMDGWRPETRIERADRLTSSYVRDKEAEYKINHKRYVRAGSRMARWYQKHRNDPKYLLYKRENLGKPKIIDYNMQEEFASENKSLPTDVRRHNRKKERREWNDVEPAWKAQDPRRRLSWAEFCRDFMGQNYGAIAQDLLEMHNSEDPNMKVQFMKFMMEMGKQGNPQSMQLDLNAKVEQRSSMYAVLQSMSTPMPSPASLDTDDPADPDPLAYPAPLDDLDPQQYLEDDDDPAYDPSDIAPATDTIPDTPQQERLYNQGVSRLDPQQQDDPYPAPPTYYDDPEDFDPSQIQTF